ncbi:MAG: AI-2E family transporter [Planctomycetota bacterium]
MSDSNETSEPKPNKSALERYMRSTGTDPQTICLVILAVFVVMYAVYWLRPVLVPFVVAVFVVSGVGPILTGLERRLGVNRVIASGITLVLGALIVAAFGVAIGNSVVELNKNKAAYQARVETIVDSVEARLPAVMKREKPDGEADVENRPEEPGSGESVDRLVRDGIGRLAQTLMSFVSSILVVLIYVFFLLIGTPTHKTAPAVLEIVNEVRSYLRLKSVISAVTGLIFGAALWLFGVPAAFAFGVLAFLLNFVPNIGPLFATLLPIPLILLAPDHGIGWMIACIVVISTIQMVSGNFVEPKMMGESSDLHPVTILLALMFWGMMWGLVGMFLATPITSVVKLMLDRVDATRPIANLMAGRWDVSEDDDESEEESAVEQAQPSVAG